ncbi:phosphoribosylamine--glycine ligase [Slackia exigua]|uniref:Phosphoribosylamine--glycine ligase n=1 Tax=Slackia exigua (strain ATCC 700122 / DSM 15923 / CIP 105133 / JCM 11022 / KCTC 5966 / S-7) TaxID=649764 RepID=D0WHD6_SLAES|nr:phosphoribosylamine--glycine ligase [Slackia exigua]EEZ61100.1 phosphoribosylamine--glycine ligase [Slackia exigua ATCC 700122]STN99405.1 Phosphoribosylamine--glycine ligase [Slackia exigua]
MMNVLVLGSGGREHALAWSIAKSPQVGDLFIAPGNGGTVQCGRNVPLDPCDAEAVIGFSKDQGIGLVVIGPEAPLVAGVADAVRAAGIPVFGPNADAARLEGSKSFSKEFMIRHGLPTARYRACDCEADALAFVRETGAPIVVKADGLAAGKGVVVADDLEEAEEAVHDCFAGAFGTAGSSVVIEECLVGPECSMLAFITDGEAVCMPCAQDHKRAFDGDRGPNTGGMGAYSPVPAVDDALETRMADIMRTAAAATKEEFGAGYRGVLYGGFMLTEEGPKLLEFNARFGDPETQAVLARFDGDVLDAFLAVAEGRAGDVRPSWSDKVSVCVVLASGGYPGSYEKGKVILGIEEAEEMDGVLVFQAGTSYNADDELITSGGRVLNVVALADSFEEARELAYEACDKINFEGKQMRFDIAKRAIEV